MVTIPIFEEQGLCVAGFTCVSVQPVELSDCAADPCGQY
jgi:hypothetical protein